MTKRISVFQRPADMEVSVGDALFLDGNGRKVFYHPNAISSTPSGHTFVGVVFNRKGNQVKILNKSKVDAKYKTEATADGTASDTYYKKTGATTNYRGIMNVARGVAYWATNGRTPSSQEAIVKDGNDNPVTQSAFETSNYCSLLRQTYANYEAYIRENYGIMYPQNYGCFNLSDGKTITNAYNDSSHPAFQHCAGVSYGSSGGGLYAGDWWLPGVQEGVELMEDTTLAKVASTMTKFGGTAPTNSSYRWFAQRYNSTYAWIFYGGYGYLDSYTVTSEFTVQAVTLLQV